MMLVGNLSWLRPGLHFGFTQLLEHVRHAILLFSYSWLLISFVRHIVSFPLLEITEKSGSKVAIWLTKL